MNRSPHRILTATAALTAAALLATTAPAAMAASDAVAPEPLAGAQAPTGPGVTSPQEALAAARALRTPLTTLAARRGATLGARDATLVLRDLAAALPSLTGPDRAEAEALLARPSENPDSDGIVSWGGGPEESTCSAVVDLCVHWTTSGQHAPPPADTAPANGVPDWVDTTLTASEKVWAEEVESLGYKEPLPDDTSPVNGGGDELDIYLADVGGLGYYGYCTSDDPKLDLPATPARRGLSAYCVLDDDYAPAQFPVNTPVQNLRVTAAHEFFHAVQFAYDFYEDRWLMESTAAWVEDVVFDSVDDNRQYLRRSPLKVPNAPVDWGQGGYQYGSWIFFRYLSERYDDSVVRGIWQRADDTTDQVSTDDLATYSLRAIDATLRKKGSSLAKAFGSFAAANTTPGYFYEEGRRYPRAQHPKRTLSAAHPRTGWLYASLDHLSAQPLQLKRGPGVARSAKVRIAIDAPKAKAQPQARIVVRYANGTAKIVTIRLNQQGDGAATVAFGSRRVAGVVAVLANASSRYRSCWSQAFGPLSCWTGIPVDDDLRYHVSASLR